MKMKGLKASQAEHHDYIFAQFTQKLQDLGAYFQAVWLLPGFPGIDSSFGLR